MQDPLALAGGSFLVLYKNAPRKIAGSFQSVEKVLRLFRQSTSALRARFVGVADKPHTCADRSVFRPGRPVAKNGFKKPASRANLTFFDKLKAPRKIAGSFFSWNITCFYSRDSFRTRSHSLNYRCISPDCRQHTFPVPSAYRPICPSF